MKTHQFKAKGSEIKPYPLCLRSIAKGFTVDKKNRLKGSLHDFSVTNETMNVSDIVSIHKYLMKNHDILH